MFTPQQLADLALFNSMQAMTMAQMHGDADAARKAIGAELENVRAEKDELQQRAAHLEQQVADLNGRIGAMQTLHAAQLAEAQQAAAAVPVPPGVYLDGAGLVTVPAAPNADPAPGQPWHVTGE